MKRIDSILMILVLMLSYIGCYKFNQKDTIKFDNKETAVIAHRGLSGLAVENTKTAFVAAGERSYYGIEADLRRTADGKFIVCHDDHLFWLSGRFIKVEERTLDELLSVPLFGKNILTDAPERLTDLEGYISVCKQYGKQAILEFKSSFIDEEIGQIVKIISDLDYIEKVTFITYNFNNLISIRKLLPDQQVQCLLAEYNEDMIEKILAARMDLAIKYTFITKDIVEKFHNAGLKVNCWTVDNKIIAEQLVNLGVDFITTNILE